VAAFAALVIAAAATAPAAVAAKASRLVITVSPLCLIEEFDALSSPVTFVHVHCGRPKPELILPARAFPR